MHSTDTNILITLQLFQNGRHNRSEIASSIFFFFFYFSHLHFLYAISFDLAISSHYFLLFILQLFMKGRIASQLAAQAPQYKWIVITFNEVVAYLLLLLCKKKKFYFTTTTTTFINNNIILLFFFIIFYYNIF